MEHFLMRLYLIPAGLTFGLALALTPAAFAAAPPPAGRLAFDVTRKGADIGDHVITFTGGAADFDVAVTTDIAVRVPLIRTKVYSYEQQSSEQWRDGQLVHLVSKTDNDGKAEAVDAGVDQILPGSLWSADTVQATRLVNTIDGTIMRVHSTDLGAERIEAGGRAIEARHYRIAGDLDRDVWYDANGYLVRLTLVADDGSTVVYVRK
jgi:hypothetical protein